MVLVGMLICFNYNTLDYGKASYWLIYLGQGSGFSDIGQSGTHPVSDRGY